jgi:hypothetical protein
MIADSLAGVPRRSQYPLGHRDPRGMRKGVTVKKQEKMKRNLRLEREVLVQLNSSGLQKVVGGLSIGPQCTGGCETAFC